MDRALPAGFDVGHWTDPEAATGCTVVLAPGGGAVASGEVRGGGPGTRETDRLSPLVSATEVHAILLTGGSAFGLAAADGVVRWLEAHGRGHWTPGGLVPLVPAAVVYDLVTGDAARRPGPDDGYAACEAAGREPAVGTVGAGTGAAVGKLFGRERAVKSGVGLAAQDLPAGPRMTALAVVNAFGDVVGEDGRVLAGARGEDGGFTPAAEFIRSRRFALPPRGAQQQLADSTTLVAILTDAALTKAECAIVAKMAHAGMARAVDPVHSAFDGDVVFVLASGATEPVDANVAGVVAAALTAEAIRDGCRSATSLAGIPALRDLDRMEPIVVAPGEGRRLGNVEFLARTVDTPRFNFQIIEIAPGRELEQHAHREEDDAFYILAGEMTFVFGEREVAAPPGTFVLVPPGVAHGFRNPRAEPVRMLNIHAPAGFDRRIGLPD